MKVQARVSQLHFFKITVLHKITIIPKKKLKRKKHIKKTQKLKIKCTCRAPNPKLEARLAYGTQSPISLHPWSRNSRREWHLLIASKE